MSNCKKYTVGITRCSESAGFEQTFFRVEEWHDDGAIELIDFFETEAEAKAFAKKLGFNAKVVNY